MQRTLESSVSELHHKSKLRPKDYDYSVKRCKQEKLSEQMSVEKALTVLKIPQSRNVNYNDRTLLDDSFRSQLHKRVRVSDGDPDYRR